MHRERIGYGNCLGTRLHTVNLRCIIRLIPPVRFGGRVETVAEGGGLCA